MTNDLYLAIEDDERTIDRLTEDEGDAAFLNALDEWDAESDYDYLTEYAVAVIFGF